MSHPEADAPDDTPDEELVEELDRRAEEALEDGELVSFAEHNERRND